MKTKTKNKTVELNAFEKFMNALMNLNIGYYSLTLLPYHFFRDMWDGRRKKWRLPRGLQSEQLTWYSQLHPCRHLRRHGVYAFAVVIHRRVVPDISNKGKFEKRPVITFWYRRRQKSRVNQLLQKYTVSSNTLNWMRYYK